MGGPINKLKNLKREKNKILLEIYTPGWIIETILKKLFKKIRRMRRQIRGRIIKKNANQKQLNEMMRMGTILKFTCDYNYIKKEES